MAGNQEGRCSVGGSDVQKLHDGYCLTASHFEHPVEEFTGMREEKKQAYNDRDHDRHQKRGVGPSH